MTPSLALLAALAASAASAAPLTLDEALAESARANADVELSRAQAAGAEVDAYEAWAGVLPRLDLTVSLGRLWTGAQRTAPGFGLAAFVGPATDAPAYEGGLALQLPIFDGGRNWNTIRRAGVSARAAARSLDEAQLGVAFETARRFYEVVKAQESLRVLEATVSRSEEIVRRAEALFQAGRGSRADAITAQGNLGSDRIAVEQGRARLAQVRADLAVELGRVASEDLEVVPSEAALAAAPESFDAPPQAELLARARRARPLLAAQGEGVRAAELSESIARGAWFPTLAARATYDRQSPTLAGDFAVFGALAEQYSATAGVVLTWNLFDGRRTLAEEQRAAVASRRARTQASQAEQQVSAEIARARANLAALGRAAVLAADNLATAEQGIRLARERLDAGAASQLEVRDASLKLTQAELTLVQSRLDQVVARADLNRAVGGTL